MEKLLKVNPLWANAKLPIAVGLNEAVIDSTKGFSGIGYLSDDPSLGKRLLTNNNNDSYFKCDDGYLRDDPSLGKDLLTKDINDSYYKCDDGYLREDPSLGKGLSTNNNNDSCFNCIERGIPPMSKNFVKNERSDGFIEDDPSITNEMLNMCNNNFEPI